MAILFWLIAILTIGGIYLIYITITQPEAGMRIFGTIFTILGRLFYGIAIIIYKIGEGIFNFFAWIFRRKK